VEDAWFVEQVRPHLPQLAESPVLTSISQPFVMSPSQLPYPELQLMAQAPELHVGLEFG